MEFLSFLVMDDFAINKSKKPGAEKQKKKPEKVSILKNIP